MPNQLTREERQPIFTHLDGITIEAAQLMASQRITDDQMTLIARALDIIRAALRLETR